MTLSQFYNEVARHSDTAGTAINAAETSRVLSEAFLLLSGMSAAEASGVIAAGLKKAAKKPAPRKPAKRKTAKKK
jgi:hypothetical protein